jgi:hypothetical protein
METGSKFYLPAENTFGLVIRGDIDDMNDTIDFINDETNLVVVYQKVNSSELYITDKKPEQE